MRGVDRYWLLTWTTYGQWLPGDDRGSVTRLHSPEHSHRIEADEFGMPPTDPIPNLADSARRRLRCAPVRLTKQQANLLSDQFHETCEYRRWFLAATAIMANHIHVLVGVPGDPEPDGLLRDLKSYGSRRLNTHSSRPASGTWWTQSGSTRRMANEVAVLNAISYIRDQDFAHVIWVNPATTTW